MAQKKTDSKKAAKKTAVKVAKKTGTRKKTAAKKAPSRAVPKPDLVTTTVIAKVDVSYGNTLFIRGEGGGLTWTEGQPMENVGSDEWVFHASNASGGLVFKFLINDEIWSLGEDLTVPSGGTSVSAPTFG